MQLATHTRGVPACQGIGTPEAPHCRQPAPITTLARPRCCSSPPPQPLLFPLTKQADTQNGLQGPHPPGCRQLASGSFSSKSDLTGMRLCRRRSWHPRARELQQPPSQLPLAVLPVQAPAPAKPPAVTFIARNIVKNVTKGESCAPVVAPDPTFCSTPGTLGDSLLPAACRLPCQEHYVHQGRVRW